MTAVYTSSDMEAWTLRSEMIWQGVSFPRDLLHAGGITYYDAARSRFVGWASFFELLPDGEHPPKPGCWIVGESHDGISFIFLAQICDAVNVNATFIETGGCRR